MIKFVLRIGELLLSQTWIKNKQFFPLMFVYSERCLTVLTLTEQLTNPQHPQFNKKIYSSSLIIDLRNKLKKAIHRCANCFISCR